MMQTIHDIKMLTLSEVSEGLPYYHDGRNHGTGAIAES